MLLLLTPAYLLAKGACAEHVSKFETAFDAEGLDLAFESPERDAFVLEVAVLAGLDFEWAAKELCSQRAYKVYNETCAPAYKVYNETRATACKVYNETCAPAEKVYNETRAPAYKVYNETCAPAYKVYNETRAPALLAAIRLDGLQA